MPTPGEALDSLIGPSVVIRGEVTSRQEHLTIMGAVEGTIHHDQLLTIHRDGTVDAEIRAQEVIVEGTVNGNIHGTERVRITKTGRVDGNVYTQLFSVDEGGVIKGSVIMDADAETVAKHFQKQTQTDREALPAKKVDARAKLEDGAEASHSRREG